MERFEQMPAVALRGMTILPDTMIHFDLVREKSIRAVEEALKGDRKVFLVSQKKTETEDPVREDLYSVGCIASVKQVTKLPDHLVRVLVEGIARGRVVSLEEENGYLLAEVENTQAALFDEADETDEEAAERMADGAAAAENTSEEEAMKRNIKEQFAAYCKLYPRTGRTLLRHMEEISDAGKLMDQIVENIPVDYTVKQSVLEAVGVEERYETLAGILSGEIEVAKIRTELSEKVKERVDKNQKDYILREQMKYIQEELGEDDLSESAAFESRLEQLKAGREVKEKIGKEIARFKRLSGNSAEAGVQRYRNAFGASVGEGVEGQYRHRPGRKDPRPGSLRFGAGQGAGVGISGGARADKARRQPDHLSCGASGNRQNVDRPQRGGSAEQKIRPHQPRRRPG